MIPSVILCEQGPAFSRIVHGLWRLSEWNLDHKETIALIEACLELGITTFDHADIYGGYSCEELFGEAFAESGIGREKIQLVTKCGIKLVSPRRPNHAMKSYDTGMPHIVDSVDRSLKNLRTHYIDLLLIHRPDPLMDADETAEAFRTLRDAGKVLHFGVSNFTPRQYELLDSRVDFPLATNQVEYSPLNMAVQDDGTLDLCQQLGTRPMAWSPFAGGRLFSEESPEALRTRAALGEIGSELGGAPLDQVALAWIMRHPAGFLPILGTGRTERIRSAAESANLTLTREQWFKIWTAAKGHGVP